MSWRPLLITSIDTLPGRKVRLMLPDGAAHTVPLHAVRVMPATVPGQQRVDVKERIWREMGLHVMSAPLPDETVTVPDDLRETLPTPLYRTPPNPGQEQGYRALAGLRVGAIDMPVGAGKTKLIIDLAVSRYAAGRMERVLFMAPVTALDNIRAQFAQHAHAAYTMYVFGERTGPDDPELQAALNAPGLVVFLAGTQSLSHGGKDQRVVRACELIVGERTMMVLDEGDEYKGHHAKRTVHVQRIGACCRYRLVMSGTLMPESVRDVFTLYRFLDERIIPERRMATFEKKFVTFDAFGRPNGSRNMHVLAARLAPYTFRWHPASPEVRHRTVEVPLPGELHRHYERVRDAHLRATGFDRTSKHAIFRMFLALQQVLCGYEGVRSEGGDHGMQRLVAVRDNPKLQAMLREVQAAPGPCLVWCKYRAELADAAVLLREALGPTQVCVLQGGMARAEREAQLARFRSGAVKVLITNAATGGRSLNGLQVATTAIYLSNTFKNTDRVQSLGRITRQPRTGVPEVVDLVAVKPDGRPTIDAVIMRSIARKQDLLETLAEELEKEQPEQIT